MAVRFLPLLIALSMRAFPLCAQDSLTGVLDSLRAGTVLRVRATDGSRITARLLGRREDPPALVLRDIATPVFPYLIDSLWVRKIHLSSGARTGAIYGGIVVLLNSAVTCLFFDTLLQVGDCTSWESWVLPTLVGGAVGALIGTGYAAVRPSWRLTFARRRVAGLGLSQTHAIKFGVSVAF